MNIKLTKEQLDEIAFYLITWGDDNASKLLTDRAWEIYRLLKPYRNK